MRLNGLRVPIYAFIGLSPSVAALASSTARLLHLSRQPVYGTVLFFARFGLLEWCLAHHRAQQQEGAPAPFEELSVGAHPGENLVGGLREKQRLLLRTLSWVGSPHADRSRSAAGTQPSKRRRDEIEAELK